MGIFSSIWKSIKNIIKSVLNAIAKVVNDLFGSPVVASLVMFVVVWMVTGTPFVEFLANPTQYLLSSSLLMAAAINVVISVLTTLIPSFAEWMGKIMGFLSFVLLAIGVWNFLSNGTLFIDLIWLSAKIGTFGLTAGQFFFWFQVVSWFSTLNFVAGMAMGPDSEYVTGWIDGFSTVPEAVADAADSILDGVVGSLFGLIGEIWPYLAVGYVGYKVVNAATEPSVEYRKEANDGDQLGSGERVSFGAS